MKSELDRLRDEIEILRRAYGRSIAEGNELRAELKRVREIARQMEALVKTRLGELAVHVRSLSHGSNR